MISDEASFKSLMIVLHDLAERADAKKAEWMYRQIHKELRFLMRKFAESVSQSVVVHSASDN